jgi:hypothetical protein
MSLSQDAVARLLAQGQMLKSACLLRLTDIWFKALNGTFHTTFDGIIMHLYLMPFISVLRPL